MGHVASCTLELWWPLHISPLAASLPKKSSADPSHSSKPHVHGSLFGGALLPHVCLAPAAPGPPAGGRVLRMADAALLASPQPPSHLPHRSHSLSNCAFVSNYCLHSKHRHTCREGKYTVSHCGRPLSTRRGAAGLPHPHCRKEPQGHWERSSRGREGPGLEASSRSAGCGPALLALKGAHSSPCRLPCLVRGPAGPSPRALPAHPRRVEELGEEFTRPGGPAQQAMCRGRAASLRGASLVPSTRALSTQAVSLSVSSGMADLCPIYCRRA